MPKYFCEYCGIYLTHSSPGGRNQHSRGRKHINNKIEYFSQILYEFKQNISSNLLQMTSKYLSNMPKPQLENKINQDNINQIAETKNEHEDGIIFDDTKEMPILKTMVHIPGQKPLSVPMQYVPNIPINEKIMKAIPNKIMPPQFKKITTQFQDDVTNKEIFDINEGENNEGNGNNAENKNIQIGGKTRASKNILENLKKIKYCYNDPEPDNNEHLLTDLLKNEDEEESKDKNINK
jgi:U1 small nuclear ribonucleoprotein C